MKKRLMSVMVGVRSHRFTLCLSVIMLFAGEGRAAELIIADFEGLNPVDGVTVTAEGSTVTAVGDVPDGGGGFAAETIVGGPADGFFSTAFPTFATLDISAATEITFWIKTDAVGSINFQLHSDAEQLQASVFTFDASDFFPNTWYQITAPKASFTKPPWAPNPVVWSNVIRFQITPFGGELYDGRYTIVDNVLPTTASLSLHLSSRHLQRPCSRRSPLKTSPCLGS